MRILMISDVYFPRINGVSTSIQTFSEEFKKQGHSVTLIAPEYRNHQETNQDIIRIPSRHVPFDPEDRMMHFKRITKLIPKLRQLNFDLIHIHTPFIAHYAGIKIAKQLQIPSIITYHTLFEEYLYHYIPFLPKRFLRFFARRFSSSQCDQVKAVIAPSSIIVNLLKDYGVRNAIQIIPTGIDSGVFLKGQSEKFRKKFAIGKDKKVLLNVSRIAFEKNIGVLIDAVAKIKDKIPDVFLVIAGEGPAKKSYMRQAERLGLNDNILFVGYLDRKTELIDCYHSADLFIFSSKTETQGLVLLEAMASSVPVVSVAAMGTIDVLNGCQAAVISDGSVDDFYHKIVTLLNDDKELKTLKNEAPKVRTTMGLNGTSHKDVKFLSGTT